MTKQQIAAIQAIAGIIVDVVKGNGEQGVPAGTIYAALMAHGITLDQFNQLMGAIVGAGKLRKEGHLYFAA
jgi:hypothetical protein